VSRFLPLLQRFLLLAILLFAAGFCWVQRDTLAQAAQLTLWQAAFVFTGYFACYCLNALMACQVQWSRGTRPGLWEMLVINSYASLLGYATVMRAGYYGGKVWFYQQRYGLAASVSLGLQGWVSLLVLAANAWFGLGYGLWLQWSGQLRLPWVHWALVFGTLALVVALVALLFGLAAQSWLPERVQRWLANIRAVVASTSWREVLTLQAQAMLTIPLQALSLGVLCQAFGLPVPLPYLLLMAVVSNLSLVIALTPSNLGVRELVLWQLLRELGLPDVTLVGVLMVDRMLQFVLLSGLSIAGYQLLHRGTKPV
jgi:uncharacterized membrane protein YbhN (UPF0104 family)